MVRKFLCSVAVTAVLALLMQGGEAKADATIAASYSYDGGSITALTNNSGVDNVFSSTPGLVLGNFSFNLLSRLYRRSLIRMRFK